jgi:hypothetical protein
MLCFILSVLETFQNVPKAGFVCYGGTARWGKGEHRVNVFALFIINWSRSGTDFRHP